MVRPGTFERVYAAIKEQLRRGLHRPGDRLEPALLSEQHNASVTPVRDALHRLTGERLVEAPRHEGFRVPVITEGTLRHLYAWHRDLLRLLTNAVGLEDNLAYNEPNDMIYPTRHLLGAELLAIGKPAEAEEVYREDLKRHPNNGWAYFGLRLALTAQKKVMDAAAAKKSFDEAWSKADVDLASSAF
jgi:tetratricopeptide (TPR) repeat protein